MSKLGDLYNNAGSYGAMLQYIEYDLINLKYYHTEEECSGIEEFAYVHYKYVRLHSYNNYKMACEVRYRVRKSCGKIRS